MIQKPQFTRVPLKVYKDHPSTSDILYIRKQEPYHGYDAGMELATVMPCSDREEIANAYLFAAAPELYEALESVLAMFENQDHEPDLKEVYAATVSKIESAMSKARGECD